MGPPEDDIKEKRCCHRNVLELQALRRASRSDKSVSVRPDWMSKRKPQASDINLNFCEGVPDTAFNEIQKTEQTVK